MKVGNKVKLPCDETGTIVKINTESLDWFPFKVRIRKATLNKTNQILEFKESQIEVEA